MPVITLTTDIGQDDFLSGAIKGQMLSAHPSFNVVDITHNLSHFNYPLIAYVCATAFRYYPKNSFHVVLVNLFEKPDMEILFAQHNDQIIACPNNGVLTMITGSRPANVIAVRLNSQQEQHTLNYTQLIASTFTAMVDGNPVPNRITDFVLEEKYPLRSTIGADWMEGQIIYIDRFENVVVNITRDEFEEQRRGRNFRIQFTRNEEVNTISKSYADAAVGETLAWFNAAGYLELAINKGNIAGLFGLQGSEGTGQSSLNNKWFYQTVRIFFE